MRSHLFGGASWLARGFFTTAIFFNSFITVKRYFYTYMLGLLIVFIQIFILNLRKIKLVYKVLSFVPNNFIFFYLRILFNWTFLWFSLFWSLIFQVKSLFKLTILNFYRFIAIIWNLKAGRFTFNRFVFQIRI